MKATFLQNNKFFTGPEFEMTRLVCCWQIINSGRQKYFANISCVQTPMCIRNVTLLHLKIRQGYEYMSFKVQTEGHRDPISMIHIWSRGTEITRRGNWLFSPSSRDRHAIGQRVQQAARDGGQIIFAQATVSSNKRQSTKGIKWRTHAKSCNCMV
jgi:hypothetical protein